MASIQDEASGKKGGEIRYLTPLNIDNSTVKKYCRFKKYGIKYVDYKDSDFFIKIKLTIWK
jgi:small subunit ribosomal protein S18